MLGNVHGTERIASTVPLLPVTGGLTTNESIAFGSENTCRFLENNIVVDVAEVEVRTVACVIVHDRRIMFGRTTSSRTGQKMVVAYGCLS